MGAVTRLVPPKGPSTAAKVEANTPVGVELLLYFTAVAEEMSFTRAAKRLQIDQSWLSHKIRQLELTLSCNLFVRSTRRIELTQAGCELLEPARRLTQAAEEARRAAHLISRKLNASLRIGALPYSFWNPARVSLIDAFVANQPDTTVEVENGSSIELLEKLRRGELDVAFLCEPFDSMGLELLGIHLDEACLLVPAENELAQKTEVRLEDLKGRRVATPHEHFNPPAFEHFYGPLIQAGAIPVPTPEFEQDVMFSFAFRERLIAVCNVSAVKTRIPPDFVHRFLADHDITSQKWLARRADYETPALNAFWETAAASYGQGAAVLD